MSIWKSRKFQKSDVTQVDRDNTEWLDRYPWLPILILILLPFMVELPLIIFGLSTDPIWQQSGIVEGVRSGLLPGLSYIDPNVGFTTQALGRLAAEDWLHGTIPWWNPSSGIGLPLAGEMQPSAFFLPFVFLLLLPNGVLWMKISMQILAGLATFALLRELKMGRLAALTGGALYALNGTFAWLPGPVAVINTIPFLPLLLYGIERSRREHGGDGIIWVALAISGSLYAGFPEAAYINGLFALVWMFYRFFYEQRRWRFLRQVIYGGVLGLFLSAPLLVAFADYLVTTDALTTHMYGKMFLPIQAFANLYLPYVYGPIFYTEGNSVLEAIWNNIGGYAGVLVFFFATIGVISYSVERGLRWMLFLWVLVAWAKSFGLPPFMEIMNYIPLLKDTAFYRYSPPSWEMALVILVSMVINDLKKNELTKIRWPLVIMVLILTSVIYIAWPWATTWQWSEMQKLRMTILLGISILSAIIGLLLVVLIWFSLNGELRRWTLTGIVLMEMIILFMVPEFSGVRPGQIDTSAINFLQSHLGLSRFYTLGPIAPNYSAYFKIASINHNYLPIASNWGNYIEERLFPKLSKNSGVTFWAPPYGDDAGVEAFNRFFDYYEQLGVRYVVTNKGQSPMPSISFPTGTTGNIPLPLENGESVKVVVTVPTNIKSKTAISAVSVFQGNYGNTADGSLTVKVCTDYGACGTGSADLSESHDNSLFSIPLEKSLQVEPGESLTITITHVNATKPEALWLWPQVLSYEQTLIGPQGLIPGKALKLSLEIANSKGLRKVYSDSLLDIWELPHPEPYYTVLNGNCKLSNETRDGLVAECSTPSTLLRRELYMPGWKAKVNGITIPVSNYGGIFQTIPLGVGKNVIRFYFAPPYIGYAWIAFFLGLIGLLWQVYRVVIYFRYRDKKTEDEIYEE